MFLVFRKFYKKDVTLTFLDHAHSSNACAFPDLPTVLTDACSSLPAIYDTFAPLIEY